MRSVTAQDQGSVKSAKLRCRKTGEYDRALDPAVTEGLRFELPREPAPPFRERERKRVGRKLIAKARQKREQLLSYNFV